MPNRNKDCIGCSYYETMVKEKLVMCFFMSNDITDECPCLLCLVKPICREKHECEARFISMVQEKGADYKNDSV